MKNIAVERDLTPFKEYFESKGYNVESFEGSAERVAKHNKNLDAVIISGINENMLGMEDTNWKGMIIEARGKTPEQVEQQLEGKR